MGDRTPALMLLLMDMDMGMDAHDADDGSEMESSERQRQRMITEAMRVSEKYEIAFIEINLKNGMNVDLLYQYAVYEAWLHQMYFNQRRRDDETETDAVEMKE